MQPLNRLSAVLAAVLITFAATLPIVRPAAAQDTKPPLVVAVLDVQYIMRESSAAKAIHTELERQRETYQAELAEQEKALRAADQKLAAERTTLSQDDFVQRRKELEQQAAQLRRNVQARKEQLEGLFGSGIAQVRKALIEVVAGIAEERGITLVLSKSQVVMAASDFDITEVAMKKLNAKLPKVSLTAPK